MRRGTAAHDKSATQIPEQPVARFSFTNPQKEIGMSTRLTHILVALCGIVGSILLGIYFTSAPQLPPANATLAQVTHVAMQYYNLWFLETWIQATGAWLSVIFYLSVAHYGGGSGRLAGIITLLGSAALLAVVLAEGVFTIDVAVAASNGHQATAVTSFDVMGVFTYVYGLAPSPLIFLGVGIALLKSSILPKIFAYLALALFAAFEIVGLVGMFTSPVLIHVVLTLQTVWILPAAVVMLVRAIRATSQQAQLSESVAV